MHNSWDSARRSCPLIQHNAAEILEKMIELKWFGHEYVFFTDVGVHLAVFNPIVVYKRLLDFKMTTDRYFEESQKYFENKNAKVEKATYAGIRRLCLLGRLWDENRPSSLLKSAQKHQGRLIIIFQTYLDFLRKFSLFYTNLLA